MYQKKTLPMKAFSSGKGDVVAASIIDVILEITDWGPEALSPDFSLGKDLEMTEGQIKEFAKRLSKVFDDSVQLAFNRDFTLRQVSDQIKSLFEFAA